MPIGDLLAQISGGRGEPSPASVIQRPTGNLGKRKAGDDLQPETSKSLRVTALPKPTTFIRRTDEPATMQSRPSPAFSSSNGTSRTKLSTSATTPGKSPALTPKAPPKKGSFAEIMSRGQRAQAVMGQVGKIQHKKVERGPKKLREEMAAAQSSSRNKVGSGHAMPRTSSGPSAPISPAVRKNGKVTSVVHTGKQATPMEVKKVKKAALATTGYTGTSRPRPGQVNKKANVPRGGALLNPVIPRPSSARRRHEDEYDEDLDDFIDYDDEEEEQVGYGYASDNSSDMEAGLSDIDDEEKQAERIARKEDILELRREQSLKAAKEERRRKALEAARRG